MGAGEGQGHVWSNFRTVVDPEPLGGGAWIRSPPGFDGRDVRPGRSRPARLTITNVDSPDPVQSGSQILYTITVTNTGGAKVNNAVLTDQIQRPRRLRQPAVARRGQHAAGPVRRTTPRSPATAGPSRAAASGSSPSAATSPPPGGTTINNNATVDGDEVGPDVSRTRRPPRPRSREHCPGGQSPDLTIGKNGPLSVAAGGPHHLHDDGQQRRHRRVRPESRSPTRCRLTSATSSVSATSLFTCIDNEPAAAWPFAVTVTCMGGQVNAGANATITINGVISGRGRRPREHRGRRSGQHHRRRRPRRYRRTSPSCNNNSNTVTTQRVTDPAAAATADHDLTRSRRGLAARPSRVS